MCPPSRIGAPLAADAAPPSVDVVELDGLVVLKIIKHCHEALPGFGFCRMAGGNKSSTSDSFCIDSKDAAVVIAECEAKCDEVGCGCFASRERGVSNVMKST